MHNNGILVYLCQNIIPTLMWLLFSFQRITLHKFPFAPFWDLANRREFYGTPLLANFSSFYHIFLSSKPLLAHDLGEPDTRLSPSEPDAEKQVKKCVIEFDAREGGAGGLGGIGGAWQIERDSISDGAEADDGSQGGRRRRRRRHSHAHHTPGRTS